MYFDFVVVPGYLDAISKNAIIGITIKTFCNVKKTATHHFSHKRYKYITNYDPYLRDPKSF